MKKIMFNDKYGLTDAVLKGRKTMTRRIVGNRMTEDDIRAYLKGYTELADKAAHYKIGEKVAIAQRYSELSWDKRFYDNLCSTCEMLPQYELKGWDNKMFVKADLMPHQIRITDIKVERLQDISNEDCMREGLVKGLIAYGIRLAGGSLLSYSTPREAFADLIDLVSGKGTWKRNPWVFVYSLKVVK